MHTCIVGNDIDDVYYQAVEQLLSRGSSIIARDFKTLELTNCQLVINNPNARVLVNQGRAMDMRYCIGELCYFLAGYTDLESIAYYSSFWRKLTDDNVTVNSAYGYRLFNQRNLHDNTQFVYVIAMLFDDINTRKAVMTIYNNNDSFNSKDNPCTIGMQFLVRENKLDCYVMMRSNDIWLGTPYDIHFFTTVQIILLKILQNKYPNLLLGQYYHTAISLHVYDRHMDELKKCLYYKSTPSITPPSLVDYDVELWFDNLLHHERCWRLKIPTKKPALSSSFQNWCKDFLR